MTIDQKQATAFLANLDILIRENEKAQHLLVRASYARALDLARRSLVKRIAVGEFPSKQPKGENFMYTVYRITNHAADDRPYIGMTAGPLQLRLDDHVRRLRASTHRNYPLQADWDAGRCSLTIDKIESFDSKRAALAAETRRINRETNPYNIKRGNPGDMSGLTRAVFPFKGRRYLYAEISALPNEPCAFLMARYGISQPMVSLIRLGLRTNPEPETSFADVYADPDTQVQIDEPRRSRFRSAYKGGAVKTAIPWSPSQAAAVRDHLLACMHGRVAEFAFNEDDIAALEKLVEKATAALQVALEELGVCPPQ